MLPKMPVLKTKEFWPYLYFASYLLVVLILGELRTNNIVLSLLFLIPWFFGGVLRQFSIFIFPVILTLQIYGSMSYYGDVIRAEIHVADIYLLEKKVFGIDLLNERLTLNEFFRERTHWVVDTVTALVYLVFVPVYILVGAYYRIVWAKTEEQVLLANRYMWAFLGLNLIGYTTYYWFPAAPPWYVAEYGVGPANLKALPSAAGLLRFDQIFGLSFFENIYASANTVFGAIPSLHCANPALSMFFSWKFKSLRIFSSCFFLIMAFSALYLDHHYMIDVLWGVGYAVIVFLISVRTVSGNGAMGLIPGRLTLGKLYKPDLGGKSTLR